MNLDRPREVLDPQTATPGAEGAVDALGMNPAGPLLRWAVALPPRLLLVALLSTACSGGQTSETAPTPAPTLAPTRTTAPASPTPLNEDPLSPKPAIESPAPLGQPVCDPRAVTVTDADAVITDQVEAIYVLRTSGRPCQLEGFPTVTLLDGAGRALPVRTTPSDEEPQPVTLSAGTSLSFTLTTGRSGSCVQAAAVRVVLPGTTTPLTAATELRACGDVKTGPVTRLEDDEDEGAGH